MNNFVHRAILYYCVLLFIILSIVVGFLVYISLQNIPEIYELKDWRDVNLKTGDLFLTSSCSDKITTYMFNNSLRYFGTGFEWNHAAICVIIDGEPYVYDTCPVDHEWLKYDISQNANKESGFIHLNKYINAYNGYVGVRCLKVDIDSNKFHDVIKTHNINMVYDLNFFDYFYPKPKQKLNILNYKYQCCEAVAHIYEDAGLNHSEFLTNVTLKPFTEKKSQLFGDVIHLKPGLLLNPKIKLFFDLM